MGAYEWKSTPIFFFFPFLWWDKKKIKRWAFERSKKHLKMLIQRRKEHDGVEWEMHGIDYLYGENYSVPSDIN